jgi:hypothetical protein
MSYCFSAIANLLKHSLQIRFKDYATIDGGGDLQVKKRRKRSSAGKVRPEKKSERSLA